MRRYWLLFTGRDDEKKKKKMFKVVKNIEK